MKVVFLDEVEGTAHTGEVKNVAAGFARNYLLPRKLAAPANAHYIAIAQAKASKDARRQERVDDEARQYVLPRVEGTAIRIEVRVGEQDKLFGSVTARDVAEALQEATKVELEHRQIDLKQPIRELGAHEVHVKLTRNVTATVTVNVEALGGAEETAAAEGAGEETPDIQASTQAEDVPVVAAEETLVAADEAPAAKVEETAAAEGEEGQAEESTTETES